MQQRANFDILKIERQFFTCVAGALRQFVGVHFLLAHFKHKLAVALVGAVLPGTARLDDHAHLVTRLESRHRLNWRTEIGNVEFAAQAFGQRGFEKLDHQRLPLLANIDADLVIGKVHHDASSAVGPAPKINILEWQHIAIAAFSECGRN